MTIFLKATGSTCYDYRGITYPATGPKFDIEGMAVEKFGRNNVCWQHQFGWENLPEVLVISGPMNELNNFVKHLNSTYGNHFVGVQIY